MTQQVGDLVFRDLRNRTRDDQMQASREGYSGVLEMAVNQLGKRVIELELRVAKLEGPALVEADPED